MMVCSRRSARFQKQASPEDDSAHTRPQAAVGPRGGSKQSPTSATSGGRSRLEDTGGGVGVVHAGPRRLRRRAWILSAVSSASPEALLLLYRPARERMTPPPWRRKESSDLRPTRTGEHAIETGGGDRSCHLISGRSSIRLACPRISSDVAV